MLSNLIFKQPYASFVFGNLSSPQLLDACDLPVSLYYLFTVLANSPDLANLGISVCTCSWLLHDGHFQEVP